MPDATVGRNQTVAWPTERMYPFDPPAGLSRIRDQTPIRRFAYPDGHVGWLVTGYESARRVLGDRQFSIRLGLGRLPVALSMTAAFERLESQRDPAWRSRYAGDFLAMDPPEHTRFRRLLSGEFTVRRMEELRPRIESIVSEHLDAIEKQGPPVDLVQSYALPIPSLTICELLGVPYGERARFHRYSMSLEDPAASVDDVVDRYRDFDALIRGVVDGLRTSENTDGLLGRLVATEELTDDEVVGVGKLLVAAGHHTTKNMLALGTFALLYDERRWASLVVERSQIPSVVEELLRYLTTFQLGAFTRVALANLELGGVLVKEGESVTVALSAANRDPQRFDHPDEFDPSRSAGGHLAFGHGVHVCLGQHLARVELQAGIAGLLDRFPRLRPAVPVDEIHLHDASQGQAGVDRLPVTW